MQLSYRADFVILLEPGLPDLCGAANRRLGEAEPLKVRAAGSVDYQRAKVLDCCSVP